MIFLKRLCICSFALFVVACNHPSKKITRAFYYWRSNFNLTTNDLVYLKNVGINKLYLHFFDVTKDPNTGKVMPVAKMEFTTAPPLSFSYAPVVYITNKSLEVTSKDSIATLANRIYAEINAIALAHNINYEGLQIDCDWTDATGQKYFALLTELKTDLKKDKRILSATIRLHQIKYADKTGVPPVDRGMLMFYNMGKINDVKGYNSIYNPEDAGKYTSYISSYPLPLDIALPIYSWAIQIRNGKPIDLLQVMSSQNFSDTSQFLSGGTDIFVSRNSFFFRGRYFMKNDTIKIESVSPSLCQDAATNASHFLKPESRTVGLFEYDSLYISKYDKQDIEKIFSAEN